MDRCQLVSANLDEPLPGTAAVAPAWVLIEDLGPWGHEALVASTIEGTAADQLATRAKAAGVRVQLIRRLSRVRTSPKFRTVFLVHSGPGDPWIQRLHVADKDLLDLDLRAATHAQPPVGLGEPVDEDLYLVCTHGKRDACCAEFGRPVAESMTKRAPEQTWETSHTGGHRFAGVLIALPEGHTFGRLVKRDITTLTNALASDRIPLANYRGRSAVTGPAQAAEIAVREASKISGRRAVRAVGVIEDGGAHVVTVDADGEQWRAVVASRPLGTLRAVSCGGHPEDRMVHQVIGVAPMEAAPVRVGG